MVATGPSLCVFCRVRPVDPAWRPFCGERCKVRDLARWSDGSYQIAGEPVDPNGNETTDHDRDPDSHR